MSSAAMPLSALQAWFQTAISSGHAMKDFRPGQIIKPAGNRTHNENEEEHSRLHIYARAYLLRLQECLLADFPMTAALMGPELFDFFCRHYIYRHPSGSPSLYDFGEGFADFLARSQPANVSQTDATLAFPVTLARLERCIHKTMRAPGLENIQPSFSHDCFSGLLTHPQTWAPAPCLQLMESPFPLLAYWKSARESDYTVVPPPPEPVSTFLALTRKHYRLHLYELPEWQFRFLQSLQSEAAFNPETLAQQLNTPSGDLLADICLWADQAVGMGLIWREI